MWHITSGEIQGISGKECLHEAFVDLFDAWISQTGHFPDLGVLGVGSEEGFQYTPENTEFFLTEWALFGAKRIPKMSHGFDSPQEQFLSIFNKIPDLDEALEFTKRQDAILDENSIDAPNSREDEWADVIEVPDDYPWAE